MYYVSITNKAGYMTFDQKLNTLRKMKNTYNLCKYKPLLLQLQKLELLIHRIRLGVEIDNTYVQPNKKYL